MKFVVILAGLLLHVVSIKSQSCSDNCTIVCGGEPNSLLTGPSLNRKKEKVGLSGETGLSGTNGADNTELVSKIEFLMSFMYKKFKNEIAKGFFLVILFKNNRSFFNIIY